VKCSSESLEVRRVLSQVHDSTLFQLSPVSISIYCGEIQQRGVDSRTCEPPCGTCVKIDLNCRLAVCDIRVLQTFVCRVWQWPEFVLVVLISFPSWSCPIYTVSTVRPCSSKLSLSWSQCWQRWTYLALYGVIISRQTIAMDDWVTILHVIVCRKNVTTLANHWKR
jgi:hypothetical protein